MIKNKFRYIFKNILLYNKRFLSVHILAAIIPFPGLICTDP